MKLLTLNMHANLKQDAADIINESGYSDNFTFTNIEGHGMQTKNDPLLSTRDKVVGYVPRVKLEILVDESHIMPLLHALRKSKLGANEFTSYWVTNVSSCGLLSQVEARNDNGPASIYSSQTLPKSLKGE